MTAAGPRLSAVIVNYNAGALLAESVGRVLGEPVVAQVVVVDNASRDDSLMALRLAHGADRRLRVLENPANLGFARAANRGLAAATADYLLLLNPDNLIEPGSLAGLLEVLAAHPGAGMLGCRILNPDGSEQRGGRRRLPTLGGALKDFFRLGGGAAYDLSAQPLPEETVPVEAISGSFMLLRREALERVGGLDEGYFLHCEDLDWCKRFRAAGYDILFSPRHACRHYQGACGAGRPFRVEWHKHRGMWRYYRRHHGRNPLALALAGLLILAHLPLAWLGAARRQGGVGRAPGAGGAGGGDATGPWAVVLGAGSLVGQYLVPALVQGGYRVAALTRRPGGRPRHPRLYWVDEEGLGGLGLERCELLVGLAPVWVTADFMGRWKGPRPRRVLALSSTSAETKRRSRSRRERAVARRLEEGERRLAEAAASAGLTLIRPTLIYGQGRDKTVAFIARWLTRSRFLPVVGNGRRQPVHASDLAAALVAAAERGVTGTYVLGGGECLTVREMVRRIARLQGRPLRLVEVPAAPLRFLLGLARRLPGLGFLEPAMVDRMLADLCVDNAPAVEALGREPAGFLDGAREAARS